jgi:hypothetical protein
LNDREVAHSCGLSYARKTNYPGHFGIDGSATVIRAAIRQTGANPVNRPAEGPAAPGIAQLEEVSADGAANP